MRIHIRIAIILMFAVALLAGTSLHPQTVDSPLRTNGPRPEIAADFTYINSNSPVGGCGCFGLYGASLTLAIPVSHGRFSIIADASAGQKISITANQYRLTLSTFTAGVRYTPSLHESHLHPFAQATAGVAHASENLVAASVPNADASLALDLGGGVDFDLNHRFRIRLGQLSYLLTTFDNGSSNHQNNLRVNGGLVFRF